MVEEQPAERRPTLRAFFPHVIQPTVLEARVRAYLGSLGALGLAIPAAPTISALPDGDWGQAWREHFRPLAVGRRLLVAPPWDVPRAGERTVLIIEPGRAFGTGSGILAVAAARLGVARIVAVDEDPDAIAAATANAESNGVAARIDCRLGDAAVLDLAPAPLVLANLLTAAHVKMGQRYRRLVAPGGTLVLGGILDTEADGVRDALGSRGFAPTATCSIEGWSGLEFRAPVHDRP